MCIRVISFWTMNMYLGLALPVGLKKYTSRVRTYLNSRARGAGGKNLHAASDIMGCM